MRLYLSSYKIGNRSEELQSMLDGLPKVVGYIANSIDHIDTSVYSRTEVTCTEFQNRGYEVNEINLRDYFDKGNLLEEELKTCGLLRVRGGNTFVLRQAMFLSGFDNIIKQLWNENYPIIYGGYSAGCCVLSNSLKGLEVVDDPDINCYSNSLETIREGLGLIDFLFLPHYKSDHPESKLIDETVDYCISNGITYKTITDGEVIIV